jgi:hypothetical protein
MLIVITQVFCFWNGDRYKSEIMYLRFGEKCENRRRWAVPRSWIGSVHPGRPRDRPLNRLSAEGTRRDPRRDQGLAAPSVGFINGNG